MGEKRNWRLIIDQLPQTAAMNMAIDEAIQLSHQDQRTRPTLRLYQWKSPTLSIGYSQRIDRDIDVSTVIEQGVNLVRRSTGGRAVLHHREITYSIIIGENYNEIPKGIVESYKHLSQGFLKALGYLGIEAECSAVRPKGNHQASPACYDAPSWYEILVQGKKLIGSAQVRKENTILQHGSIPIEHDIDILFSLLKFSNQSSRQRMKERFQAKSIALEDTKGGNATIEEIYAAIVKGFSETLSIDFQFDSLSAEEMALAESLVLTKYGTDAWNYKY